MSEPGRAALERTMDYYREQAKNPTTDPAHVADWTQLADGLEAYLERNDEAKAAAMAADVPFDFEATP